MDKTKKQDANQAEDIAAWLGRETGHTEAADEAYDASKGMEGLPQKRKAELSRFFDGLEAEKAQTAQRREGAVADVQDAEELRKAIAPRLSEGMGNATSV